jgi:hypothetical protein
MMKVRIWSATCAAIAVGTAITVLAQDPSAQPPRNPPSSQTSQAQSAPAKAITVSGCLQRAQQGPTGTTGTRETTPGANEPKFVLTNASISPSGTAGTTGATAPATTAIASEYRLDTDEAKLTPHVGHKVEITGTVEQPSRTEQRPTASAANAPTLKVTEVKMVAPTCP